MVRQHSEQRGERFDDNRGSWLGDRGVSEVIGSILVFGLLVALLAVVQTQAVPNANNEVEVKHNNDVQGDMADLQAAITRTGTFGGAASVTIETGMSYPPRLVLFNPPAVQGTLATGAQAQVELEDIDGANEETADFLASSGSAFTEWETSLVSYRVDYNRYSDAPTVRYEHSAVVNDFGDESTVETGGSLVSGNRISLILLGDGLQESQVRPASVTTYPVSAPAQTVPVEVGSDPGTVRLPTDVSETVWTTKILSDQYDTDAFDDSPAETGVCNGVGSNVGSASQDDGRFVVGCEYDTNANAPNEITIYLQPESTYDLAVSRVGFTASPEPTAPTYLTDTKTTSDEVTVEIRDKYNNPVAQRVTLEAAPADQVGVGSSVSTTQVDVSAEGRSTLARQSEDRAVFITSGPNAYDPAGTTSCDVAPGCVTVPSQGLDASSFIRVTNVSGDQSADSITFEFTNSGDRDTKIDEVQLGYATQRNERTLTVTIGTLSDCDLSNPDGCTLDQTDVTTSFVTDGPSEITQLANDTGATFSPNTTDSIGAEENRAPVQFDTNGNDPGGVRPELQAGSSSDVTFSLDDSITFDGEDSVDLSVTVYYEDGSVATYSRTLFNEQGDRGQS